MVMGNNRIDEYEKCRQITGRFDDQQLFYLMARGIPEGQARRLVVRGFFAQVVARIAVPEVEEHLMAAIERELAGAQA